MSPRGRRPGSADTRGEIVEAAGLEFGAKGYDATSLRAIARRAGVDPALVHHYFANKPALFAEVMSVPVDVDRLIGGLLAQPRDAIGAAMVRSFIGIWDQPEARVRFEGLMRSAVTHPDARRMLREFVTREIFIRVTMHMDGVAAAAGLPAPPVSAEVRGGLAASQMIGLGMVRYVLAYQPITDANIEELVALVGPTLQAYVAPPAGERPVGERSVGERSAGERSAGAPSVGAPAQRQRPE